MSLQALRPYPYQREALDRVAEDIKNGVLRPAVLLPTGGGKTVCFAHQSLEWLQDHDDDRVLVLVHTDELVQQAVAKLRKVAPHLNIGIVKAARNEVDADVIVASVQSLRNPVRRKQIKRVSLVIVDECHHATAKTYQDILEHFDCATVGYTATLMRGDGKSLYPTWNKVSFSRDIGWMVRKRYLVPPRGRAVEVPDLDLRTVKATRTDYRDGELGEALAESLAPVKVAEAYLEHAAGRRGLLFAPTVASAQVFADALNELGVKAEVIHGGMADAERGAVLERHRSGITQVLCNCMILTEGYDDPAVSCIVVARPTKSQGLYIQIVGRGLRVDPARPYEEQDCLVLDVVGASQYNDLRSLADLSDKPLKPEAVRSGKTLVELEDELDAGEGVPADQAPVWTGDTVTREFDPLGRPSTKVWMRSAGGTFFVPAGKSAYVFIMEYPEAGQWSVAWCGSRASDRFEPDDDGILRKVPFGGRNVGMSEHRGLPLDQALVWAGDLATDLGADLNTDSRAAWRKKPASDPLKDLARNLGLTVATGERMGPVSDRVNQIMGSRRVDPIVRGVRRGPR